VGPGAADRRKAFEAKIRVLPWLEWLAAWYRRQRAQWWCRFAVHRLFADAAAGTIAVYGSSVSGLAKSVSEKGCSVHRTPASFFQSDIHLDVERGQLFSATDTRVPLARFLRVYRADDAPRAAVEAVEFIRERARRAAYAARRRAQPRHAVAAE
jgi:hypothetical protein